MVSSKARHGVLTAIAGFIFGLLVANAGRGSRQQGWVSCLPAAQRDQPACLLLLLWAPHACAALEVLLIPLMPSCTSSGSFCRRRLLDTSSQLQISALWHHAGGASVPAPDPPQPTGGQGLGHKCAITVQHSARMEFHLSIDATIEARHTCLQRRHARWQLIDFDPTIHHSHGLFVQGTSMGLFPRRPVWKHSKVFRYSLGDF